MWNFKASNEKAYCNFHEKRFGVLPLKKEWIFPRGACGMMNWHMIWHGELRGKGEVKLFNAVGIVASFSAVLPVLSSVFSVSSYSPTHIVPFICPRPKTMAEGPSQASQHFWKMKNDSFSLSSYILSTIKHPTSLSTSRRCSESGFLWLKPNGERGEIFFGVKVKSSL